MQPRVSLLQPERSWSRRLLRLAVISSATFFVVVLTVALGALISAQGCWPLD